MCRRMPNGTITREHARSTPPNKSLRGSRGPEAGVRGIPSAFIKIYERGRDTPHPSLLPLLRGKTFLTRYTCGDSSLSSAILAHPNQAGQNLGRALLSNRRIELLSLRSLHAL